jgi:hypothetical protein
MTERGLGHAPREPETGLGIIGTAQRPSPKPTYDPARIPAMFHMIAEDRW